MRLVNTLTKALEEVWSETNIPYAILSHRWEDDEVSYQEMQRSSSSPTIRDKKGYAKIQRACAQALKDGFQYIWCDTCCIDKTSSAELTEAINSMFTWYKRSALCYVYLSDVVAEKRSLKTTGEEEVPRFFAHSAWFRRGWTLQELIAPDELVFYDLSWEFLGTKASLTSVISSVTGIDDAILKGESVFNRSIAQRMSWASNRVTTRVEDAAYCLLGLFDVNMPMLYGEGTKSFLRLQQEIIRQSDDHSIFAWPKKHHHEIGLLADSPKAFERCQYVKSLPSRKGRSAYTLTNRGLSIKLDATPWSADTYLVALHCVNEAFHKSSTISVDDCCMGMFLRRLDEDDRYIRVNEGDDTFLQVESSIWDNQSKQTKRVQRPIERIEINVPQNLNLVSMHDQMLRVNGFRFCTPELFEMGKDGKEKYLVEAPVWDQAQKIMSMPPGRCGTVGMLDISAQDRKIKMIKLGFDFEFNPVCFIAESGGLTEVVHLLSRSGAINYGLESQEAQWSIEERAQFAGIRARSCFDVLAWSVVEGGGIAAPLRQHSGLWALKGDRVHGLSVKLKSQASELTSIVIRREIYGDRLVWVIHVGNLRDNFKLLKSVLPSKKDESEGKRNGFKLFK